MSSVTVTSRGALRKSDLREANERLLLNIIRQNTGISQSDMSRMTGFAPSSIKLIVDRMRKRGLLVIGKKNGDAPMGRRPLALELCPDAMVAMGVEIALPVTRVAMADLNGRILKQKTVAWHGNPEVVLRRVREALDGMISGLGRKQSLLGVGVSIPGTLDRGLCRIGCLAGDSAAGAGADAGARVLPRLPECHDRQQRRGDSPLVHRGDRRGGRVSGGVAVGRDRPE